MADKKMATAVKDYYVVIASDHPGFRVAKDIAKYGRICKRLSSCTCNRPEQADDREKCFDWVKV